MFKLTRNWVKNNKNLISSTTITKVSVMLLKMMVLMLEMFQLTRNWVQNNKNLVSSTTIAKKLAYHCSKWWCFWSPAYFKEMFTLTRNWVQNNKNLVSSTTIAKVSVSLLKSIFNYCRNVHINENLDFKINKNLVSSTTIAKVSVSLLKMMFWC